MKESDEVEVLYIDDSPPTCSCPARSTWRWPRPSRACAATPPRAAATSRPCSRPARASRCPLFVNVGDKVRVDTRSGEYVSRALSLARSLARGARHLALRGTRCVGPSSAARRSGRCIRAICSPSPLAETFPRDVHAFTRALAELVARAPARARRADPRVRERLVAGADRPAGALDPARRADRAAVRRRAARRGRDPARGRDRRGGRDGQAVLRRRGARVRQRDPRRRAAGAAAAR